MNPVKVKVLLISIFAYSISFNAQNVNEILIEKYNNNDCKSIFPIDSLTISLYNQDKIFWFNKGLCEFQNLSLINSKQSFLKAEELGYKPLMKVQYHLSKCEILLKNDNNAINYINQSLRLGLSPNYYRTPFFKKFNDKNNLESLLKEYDPSLTKWTSLFILFAFQGLILSLVLFFRKKGYKKANTLLGFFVISFAITLINYVIYWTGYIWVFPFNYFDKVFVPLSYTFGPLLYLYIKLLHYNNIKLNRLLHFIPFIIALLLLFASHFIDSSKFFNNTLSLIFNPWSRICHLTIYAIAIINLIRIERFNNDSNINKWLTYLTLSYLVFLTTYIAYFALVNFDFFDRTWDYMISLAITLSIIFISVMGYIQPEIFLGHKIKEALRFVKYEKSGLSDSLALDLKKKLLTLMIDGCLYKDNSINLDKLSKLLDTTRHNTSQIINEHFNANFFDFLNDFRIEEAKELLENQENNNMNITEILYEVGFNNKVSFNNAFKKRVGCTPTQYKFRMTQEAS